VTRSHALVETVVLDVGGEEPPEAPPDALASFDIPQAPIVSELPPLPAERGGLGMLSYTRLARQLEAAAIELGGSPAAIEVAELNADLVTDADAAGVDDEEPPTTADDDLPGGSDAGSYLHALLEHADLSVVAETTVAEWAARPDIAALLEDKAREWNIAPAHVPYAARVVHATLSAPLELTDGTMLPPLASASALARELEFSYPVPGASPPRALVKGFIDALVAYGDDLWVLDYKSDTLRGTDLAAAARAHVDEHYMVQARLYALAAERMRGHRRFAGLLYTFIRYNLTVAIRIEDGTLASYATWLAALPAAGGAVSP